MAENTRQLATMLVSVAEDVLLVPGSAVAEIIPFREPSPVQGKPEWFLGEVTWRDEPVPVISFDLARGGKPHERTTETRLAVINSVSGSGPLHFYAIPVEGIPRSVRLVSNDIQPLKEKAHRADVISMWVEVSGTEAIIPDLDKLEEKLLPHYSA